MNEGNDIFIHGRCLILSPIKNNKSSKAENNIINIDNIIRPVLTNLNFEIINSSELNPQKKVTSDILKLLLDVELVIADITIPQPNIMYELSARHASRRPVICIADKEVSCHFDSNNEIDILYLNNYKNHSEIQKELRETIIDVINNPKQNNPIYQAIESIVTDEWDETNMYNETQKSILKQLEKITLKLDLLSTTIKPNTKKKKESDIYEIIVTIENDNEVEKKIKRFINNNNLILNAFKCKYTDKNWKINYVFSFKKEYDRKLAHILFESEKYKITSVK